MAKNARRCRPQRAPRLSAEERDETMRSRHRFHILGVPHTISIRDYTVCAFTQKVVRLCDLLKRRGHTVIHYGHEDSVVNADEHVTTVTRADLDVAYGDHDWRVKGFPAFATDDHAYRTFHANTIGELHRRKRRGDFLLCPFGLGHKPVADAHGDMIVCEPGIGYGAGHFAPFKVFESYAMLHAYLGLNAVLTTSNAWWYDAVIPNYFDLADFDYRETKEDYLLFLGRVYSGKGVHVAVQIAEATGRRLVVAGPGNLEGISGRTTRPLGDYVEAVGAVGLERRRTLLAGAAAVLCPSLFLEPFCGVHVEAMLSGTPVITPDWGAFTEYNIHGLTGYRCRTFEHFTWAARNIGTIRPQDCRAWAAENFPWRRSATCTTSISTASPTCFTGRAGTNPTKGGASSIGSPNPIRQPLASMEPAQDACRSRTTSAPTRRGSIRTESRSSSGSATRRRSSSEVWPACNRGRDASRPLQSRHRHVRCRALGHGARREPRLRRDLPRRAPTRSRAEPLGDRSVGLSPPVRRTSSA